jgi:uncharacterized membrane protein
MDYYCCGSSGASSSASRSDTQHTVIIYYCVVSLVVLLEALLVAQLSENAIVAFEFSGLLLSTFSGVSSSASLVASL